MLFIYKGLPPIVFLKGTFIQRTENERNKRKVV